MDIKTLKEITKLMKENDLVEIDVETTDLKVRMKKASAFAQGVPMMAMAPSQATPAAAAPVLAAPAVDEFAGCRQITSPIPGTAYLKPNPDAASFVNVGTQVDENKVVCLIEAMKVFNEIKAESVKGTIKKICITEGQPVEYGTVLFLVG